MNDRVICPQRGLLLSGIACREITFRGGAGRDPEPTEAGVGITARRTGTGTENLNVRASPMSLAVVRASEPDRGSPVTVTIAKLTGTTKLVCTHHAKLVMHPALRRKYKRRQMLTVSSD
jgi:hypothetical protein